MTGMIAPRAFNARAFKSAADEIGISPLVPRKVIETAGQWRHLTLTQQHTVLSAFEEGVTNIQSDGFMSDLKMTDMGIPFGRFENEKLEREALCLSRWRACDLSAPRVIEIRQKKIEEREIEEAEKELRRIEKERNQLAARIAAQERAAKKAAVDAEKIEKGKEIWKSFVGAGYVVHRDITKVDKKFTHVQDLVNLLRFLEYDGSTEAQPPMTKLPTLQKILKNYDIPHKFIESIPKTPLGVSV